MKKLKKAISITILVFLILIILSNQKVFAINNVNILEREEYT